MTQTAGAFDTMSSDQIPGHTYGTDEVPEAPITREEFDRLKQTVLFDEDDEDALHQAGDDSRFSREQ